MIKKIGLDISVLNDEELTGIGVYTYQLIKSLFKNNPQQKFILFGIATFSTHQKLQNIEFKNHPNVEVKVFKLPAKLFRLVFKLWQKIGWPRIEELIGPVDLFHSFNWYLPPQKTGKVVATVFDTTSVTYPDWHHPKTTELDKIRFKQISKLADCVITISEHSKQDFLKLYPKSIVEVVYPAADERFDSIINKLKTKQVLQKYNLKPGYILSVSTLEPRKNLSTLIKAYNDSNLEQPLVLVGKQGWKNEELNDLLKSNTNIIRTGFVPVEDLKILYQQAGCLVYPSFYEGFGIPVLEAMKCGCPVICSDTSSLPEVGGDAVLYIDPTKKEDIVNQLKIITQEKNKRSEMINKGFKQANNFSWENSAKKLAAIYEKL